MLVKRGKHVFPFKWAEHFLMRLSTAKFELQNDPPNSINEVAVPVLRTN